MEKAKFVWICVGNGDPEPAALEGEKPNRKITTIGCADPYMIDEPDCPAWLCYSDGDYELYEIESPLSEPINEAEAAKRERAYQRSLKSRVSHGYAGFGRRG